MQGRDTGHRPGRLTPGGGQPVGKLIVVGTGPGRIEHLTEAARRALEAADVVVGYKTYLDLIDPLLVGKKLLSTGMTKEVDRCRQALELAEEGRTVALVSGGDPGIYAMAGLVLEMASGRKSPPAIEVIPGLAALNSAAARLGAPLMHDFAAISLSDLLTPMAKIEERLNAAASADFVIVLYNPKSRRRTDQIVKAREIVLKYRPASTPVGIVTAAMREDEKVTITTLQDMLSVEIGMQSCVIIGNTTTTVWDGFMITRRGYHTKYDIEE